ncbi:MAG TPA: DUF1109 domain-containing protein [Rhizomicrobium sp.]|nr:DUF1109 domain-containing protein [Rhizomicrobium sp.]
MKTDELIAHLSDDLTPVPAHYVGRVLAMGLGLGFLLSAILMLAAMGPRPDLSVAMEGGAFWMKLAYTLSFAALGLWMVERLGRSDTSARRPAAFLLVPILLLLIVAIVQFYQPGIDRHHMVMGDSWKVCAIDILTISVPAFVAVFWALRKLAPTRLTLAGAGAGLLAGGIGASVYAFHCVEYTAPFILIWYTGGMAASALIGAGISRWALRW